MFRKALNLVLALLCLLGTLARVATAQSPAQAMDVLANRQHITPLTGPWRFHSGDNAAWSQPTFDDATWAAVDPTTSWATPDILGSNEFGWFRLRILVPPNTPSLVLQLPNTYRNYELFANGTLLGQVGQLPPAPATPVESSSRLFTLRVSPSSVPQPVTLAMRLWEPAAIASVRDSAFAGPIYIGDSPDIFRQFRLTKAANLLADGGEYTVDIIGFIVGAASLVLFFLNRRARFYLWLACFVLISSLDLPIVRLGQHFSWSFYTLVNLLLLDDLLPSIVIIFLVLDVLRLARVRATVPALFFVLAELGILLVTWGHIPSVYADGIYFVFSTASELIVVSWLLRGARSGSIDARLLLISYALAEIPSILDNLGHFLADFNVPHADVITLNSYILFRTPFNFRVEQGSAILAILGMLGVLINHFARTTREHQRLTSALAAAHEVQYQLVPSNLPSFGGFSTEIAYMAAEEVGGDFCQVLPRPDGSTLIAIGDVSGKGLRAAMLGTLCVGALRSMAEERVSPAAALCRLNNAILRSESTGFVTCLCAVLSPNGAITLANAGHLAPYLNGTELPVDFGLPLGIIGDLEYSEHTLQLPEGARVTFLSDGVVEARSPSGELFGFDRTSGISHRPASEIATSAQQYGPQSDDITVLTLDWHSPVRASIAA